MIINENTRRNLESSIVDISKKSCSTDQDRMCVCGSLQTLQDSAGQTLTVDLQCSCAFSKSVNCTQTECSLPETSTTVESLAATERSFTLMPTTTTCILTTPSMASPTPTTRENNNISGMQGCNCSCDPILGALVGLQIALVIILIIGWTCTCVIMKRTQVNQSKR